MPGISPVIAGNISLYYPIGTTIFEIKQAPYSKAETINEFFKRLKEKQISNYVIDFNSFSNIDDFQNFIANSNFRTDWKFHLRTMKPESVLKPTMDPSFIAYLEKNFVPNRYVDAALED